MAETTVFHSGPIVAWLDAKAAGLKRYFTGEPCGRGHVEERAVANRQCRECLRECDRLRRLDPDARAKEQAYRVANRERKRERDARWVTANSDKVRARYRRYRKRHPAKVAAAARAYRAEHRALYTESTKRWRKANPEKANATTRARKARKRGAAGTFSATDLAEIRRLQRGGCAICGKPLGADATVDHVVPLAKGGTNDRRNLQLAHKACNSQKHAKNPIEFMRERGRLL